MAIFCLCFRKITGQAIHCQKKMQHPQGLCSLAPEYNMCILRGCSVSVSDQMTLRSLVFAHSVVICRQYLWCFDR